MALDAIESVISGSLEGLEGRDADPDNADAIEASGGAEGQVEAGTGAVADKATETASPEAKATKAAAVEDKLAAELGLDPKRKVNNIPYPRVKEIVSKKERDLLGRLGKSFGLKPEEIEALKWDDAALDGLFDTHYTKRIGDYDRQIGEHKTKLDEVAIVEQLMEGDPDKFLEALSFQYPAYKKFLQQQTAVAQEQKQAENQPPPLTNADGTTTLEMIEKNFAWREQQSQKAFEAKLVDMEKKFKPIIDADRARQVDSESAKAVNAKLTDARTNWPGFADNEKEILDTFMKDKSLSMRDAYNEVRYAKAQAALAKAAEDAKNAEKKGRERTLAELKATKPADTSVVSDGVEAGAEKPKSIEDIIREQIAGLKRN